MEIFQAKVDNTRISSNRYTTFFVVLFISFPVAVIVSSMYRNSSFFVFEGFFQAREAGKSFQNITTTGSQLGERVHNISDDNLRPVGGKVKRGTAPNVTSELLTSEPNVTTNGTVQNVTHHILEGNNNNSVSGLKNASLTGSTNESFPRVSLDNKEELLGGLLTGGFDEASCISRVQSHLFRKVSPHKASPFLISKLRNYEEIHRRCGPNTRAYDGSMRKIARSKDNGTATMCKYLIWTPVNGLGNQMISIVATFLYAILTDRVLLVKFGEDKHDLFCEPFLNSTWILPQKSPFWKENHIQTQLQKDKVNNSTSVLFINLQYTHSSHEKIFHCDQTQDLIRNIPLLILMSDQYFVPSLFMNQLFNMEISKMFPEKDTIFHHLGRYLFHPSNEAWELISRYYQAHLAKADERIGIQIRVFNAISTPKQAIMDLVLSCTLNHKILPKVDLQTSMSSVGKNETVKAVLVASLYKEFGDNLRRMYEKKATASGEFIEVYQPSHEGKQMFNDKKHNVKAWMEMYLLSLCDVLVTTSLSTFGYVAQGLGNLKPWFLYRLVKNETHFPPCEQDFSLEPCYHDPPKHYCDGKPLKDFVSSFSSLKKCKDFSFGVKLVNDTTTFFHK
ncbi:probable fucosyltransferase 7 isoform X2 [Vigna unguiculata]|uniref:probable fucosyltransferase 7 isoform X2 n=1 Tax=Vigna unguiculata TaxID=3917 RepID=UPI001015F8DF|nr:probable fucosyltransferase 7 isoform X2 [Vigna unguiculata]